MLIMNTHNPRSRRLRNLDSSDGASSAAWTRRSKGSFLDADRGPDWGPN
jgi:hypothetical protein